MALGCIKISMCKKSFWLEKTPESQTTLPDYNCSRQLITLLVCWEISMNLDVVWHFFSHIPCSLFNTDKYLFQFQTFNLFLLSFLFWNWNTKWRPCVNRSNVLDLCYINCMPIQLAYHPCWLHNAKMIEGWFCM